MLNRITFGLNALLTKLDACENWHALSMHYYFPSADDGPEHSPVRSVRTVVPHRAADNPSDAV